MALFRDKLTGKQTTTKPVQQKITEYDDTWIKINVVGGQTQLCPIKLNCSWVYPNVTQRPPQLTCKWFNKTQSQIKMIDGVFGSYYQPCLADVGTIIHVQCIPELQDAEYEGMPIIKQIGPIKIDKQTQQQSNDLLSAQKATFSIKLKNGNIHYQEGLIKIVGQQIKITTKINQQQKQLLNEEIYENNPILKCNRTKSKQLELQYQSKNNQITKINCQLTNNKVRDILILLVRLIGAKRLLNIQEETIINDKTQQITQTSQKNQQTIKQQKKQQQKPATQQRKSQSQKVVLLSQKKPTIEQPLEENLQKVEQQQAKETQVSQNKDSNKDNSKKSQVSEEDLQNSQVSAESKKQESQSPNKPVFNEIKSSEDFTSNTMTSPTIKKGGSKLQQPSAYALATPNSKQNALQILQITDLKKQLRTSQTQIIQLKKSLTQKSDVIHNLQQQLKVLKQRQANLNCNYFQLQNQIKKIKQHSQKNSQQISYYKNQNRILKAQIQNTQKKNKTLTNTINQLELKLAPFLAQDNDSQIKADKDKNQNQDIQKQQKVQSYKEVKEKFQKEKSLREQLQAKYQYMKQQVQKSQQKYKEVYELLQQAHNQTNYYKKKYQNLLSQFQNNSISSSPISAKNKSTIMNSPMSKLTSIDSNINEKVEQQMHVSLQQYTKLEKQILQIKKQIKQLIQQNNFLRSININTKDKKSSTSKTQLKLQLMQLKKIVNKLTETVTEKDMTLDHFKKINKEISQRLIQSNKKIQVLSSSNIQVNGNEHNSNQNMQ